MTIQTIKQGPNKRNRQLIAAVANTPDDFEWYPTTEEIIDCVKGDLEQRHNHEHLSILDCGAGDGRVLNALTQGNKYAIEKSRPLLDAMSRDIFIVGTEFSEQTLIDKKVEVVFSNPPYSEYAAWSLKIIREANAAVVYLVIPTRWAEVEDIKAAIDAREAKSRVIGSFDFLSADRRARANVNVVKISLGDSSRYYRDDPVTDPFELWFNDHFEIEANTRSRSEYDLEQTAKTGLSETLSNELVKGRDLVKVLEELYQRELGNLTGTYKSLEHVNAQLLRELDVNLQGVREALKQKIQGLGVCT